MSRVTDIPEEQSKALRVGSARSGGEGDEERSSARLPKWSLGKRLSGFYHDVKLEMRKTAWPTRTEVWSTTVVVIIAVIFFGFYLWGVDMLVTLGFDALEKGIR
jgi:preprotein translocase subunit SecE